MISDQSNIALPGGNPGADNPIVVTVAIDHDDLRPYERLRQRHFPCERYFLPAHLTMFHALPGTAAPQILAALDHAGRAYGGVTIDVVGLRFLGAGVAFEVKSDALMFLRAGLRQKFEPWLTRQDAQCWRPHITVQNKVTHKEARRLHDELLAQFKPDRIRMTGLDAWSYVGGPWRHIASFVSDDFRSLAPDPHADGHHSTRDPS